MNRPTRTCILIAMALLGSAMVVQPAWGGSIDVRFKEVAGFYRIEPPFGEDEIAFTLFEGFVDERSPTPIASFPVRDLSVLLLSPPFGPFDFGPFRAILNLEELFFPPFEPRFVIFNPDEELSERVAFRLVPPVAEIHLNEDGFSGRFMTDVEWLPGGDDAYSELNRLEITFENMLYEPLDSNAGILQSLSSGTLVGGTATWPVPPGSEVVLRWRLFFVPEPGTMTLAVSGLILLSGAAVLRRAALRCRRCHGISQI